MKEFLKTFALCLLLEMLFFFCGGTIIFDMRRHFYLAAVTIAFLLAIPVRLYQKQRERLEELENRVRTLENKEMQ